MTNTSFDLLDLLNDLPVTSGEITRDETSISWRKVKCEFSLNPSVVQTIDLPTATTVNLAVNRSAAPSPESIHGDLPDFEDFEDTVTASQTVDRIEYDDYDGDEDCPTWRNGDKATNIPCRRGLTPSSSNNSPAWHQRACNPVPQASRQGWSSVKG